MTPTDDPATGRKLLTGQVKDLEAENARLREELATERERADSNFASYERIKAQLSDVTSEHAIYVRRVLGTSHGQTIKQLEASDRALAELRKAAEPFVSIAKRLVSVYGTEVDDWDVDASASMRDWRALAAALGPAAKERTGEEAGC